MDIEAPLPKGEGSKCPLGTVLTFRVSYSVPGKRKGTRLQLLGGQGGPGGGRGPAVSGFLLPGEMLCILGPSGCGKTTLLDILSGRKTYGSIEGEILFNGTPPTPAMLRRHLGYVEQQDTLLSMLTPAEMLQYTAELKHPRTMPRAEKAAMVADLIRRLGLQRCQHTAIGSVLRRGISGGEAKRCNIGVALITSPQLLLVDEVTSGLDSFYGGEVAIIVKDLAREGIAVACTIHSPPPAVFALFDRVLLLQRGRVAYFGANGDALLHYFALTFPDLRQPSPSEGLADFVVDVTTRADEDPQQASKFADAYAASQLCADNDARLEALKLQALAVNGTDSGKGGWHGPHGSRTSSDHGGSGDTPASRRMPGALTGACSACLCGRQQEGTVTPMWFALLTLYRFRTLRALKRADFILPRVADKCLVTFLVATIYWGIGDSSAPDDAASTAAVLFMWSVLTAFTSMGVLPSMVLERPVYLRERADGLYRPLAYLIYKVTEEVAVGTIPSVIYSVLVFYLIRLQGSFLLFWLVYYVSMCVAIVLTLLAGAISPSVDVAGAVLPSYATTLLFFAGFMIPWDQLPSYWRWYAIIDHIRYAFGAMMVNQFSGNNNVAFRGSQTVLAFYGLEGVSRWLWLLFEFIFFWVFFAMLWASLVWVRHQRR